MKTRFSDQTGIHIQHAPNLGWFHVDTNDERMAKVGPWYESKAEILADHENYLLRAGWLRDGQVPEAIDAAGRLPTREYLTQVYFYWRNNYLTADAFAEHMGLTSAEGQALVELARSCASNPHPEI